MESSLKPVVWRARLAGAFDVHTVGRLSKALEAGEHADLAIIDLRDVPYVDSTALTQFIRLRDRMLANGRDGNVRLLNVSAIVYRIFAVTGLSALFELHAAAEASR